MQNLFGTRSPFEDAVDKICGIGAENDDWQLIMNLCDNVNTTQNGPKMMAKTLVKKIKNSDALQLEHAVTLLDACVNNCNRPFHLELCARDNLNDLKQYLMKNRSPNKGVTSLKEAMVKWSKAFGEDPQLYLLSVTIVNLKGDGVVFPSDIGNAPPVNLPTSSVSSSASTRQTESEADMIKKAIELSLKESQAKSSSQSGNNTTLYPTFTADKPLSTDRELFKVRALYDFEAAEENEISFKAGDIISVTDSSDQNWWKGRTPSSSGLFPANFATRELESAAPQPQQAVQSEPVKVTEVNPQQIDLLLEMLRKADATVTNEEEDKFIAELEESVAQQKPLIEAEYTKLKSRHGELEGINDDMSRVVGLFHKLLKEAPPVAPPQVPLPIRYSYLPGQAAPQMQQQPACDQRHFAPPMAAHQYAPVMPMDGSTQFDAAAATAYNQSNSMPQFQGTSHLQGGPQVPPSQSPPPNYMSPSTQGSHPDYYQAMYQTQPPVYSQPSQQLPAQSNIAHVSPMHQGGGASLQ